MNLNEIPNRRLPPQPWTEGEKIPWSDTEFSARMLKEHLAQDHNAASRRLPIIDRQVAWLHSQMLSVSPGRILDLGCGPGLYSHRLARLGHDCLGIDYAPASIGYARDVAIQNSLTCRFLEADIRGADYHAGHDLALFIFGEFNVFHPEDAVKILRKSYAALKPGGKILLEVHAHEAVQAIGERSPSWSASPSDLFSAQPHLLLYESFWLPEEFLAVERWFVVESDSGDLTRHSATMQAYSKDAYRNLLADTGFVEIGFRDSFSDAPEDSFPELIVITAQKQVGGIW